MTIIRDGIARAARESRSLDDTARTIAIESRDAGLRLPGLGHRLYHLINGLHSIRLADDITQAAALSLALDQGFILCLQRLLLSDD